MVEVFWMKSMKTKYIGEGGVMIRLVVNCVVNLGPPLQCLDLNILWWWILPDGGNQISLWIFFWRFLWRWIIEWRN